MYTAINDYFQSIPSATLSHWADFHAQSSIIIHASTSRQSDVRSENVSDEWSNSPRASHETHRAATSAMKHDNADTQNRAPKTLIRSWYMSRVASTTLRYLLCLDS